MIVDLFDKVTNYNRMKVIAWVDADLDGAGSAWLLKLLFKKIEVKVSTAKKFRNEFLPWIESNYSSYDKIFICDIDVSAYIEAVDRDNIVTIDHHESSIAAKDLYKKAKAIAGHYPSTTGLIYSKWKDQLNLTKEQKLLVKLINDYDSYELKYGDLTKNLNKVYWQYTGNRPEKFYNDFSNGFTGFNLHHKNAIAIYNKKFLDTISNLEIFGAVVPFGNKNYKVVSTICSFGITDIANFLLHQYNSDICIIVNPNSQTVSLRRSSECDIAMNKLAEKLVSGSGHPDSAGGIITDAYLEFTKVLKPL